MKMVISIMYRSVGRDSWYMLGHVFWNESFSKKFVDILIREYDLPQTKDLLWEAIYMNYFR